MTAAEIEQSRWTEVERIALRPLDQADVADIAQMAFRTHRRFCTDSQPTIVFVEPEPADWGRLRDWVLAAFGLTLLVIVTLVVAR